MKHITTTGQIDHDAFGSVSGKTAQEAMLVLKSAYEKHAIFYRLLVTLFNDAAGCYDRIRSNMCDIAMRRTGCPQSITNCHTITQRDMIHKIITATGVSPGHIKWQPGK